MRSMSAARWKLPAALLTTAGLLAGGAVWASRTDDPPTRGGQEKLVIPVAENAKPAVDGGWKESAVLKLTGWLAGSVTYSPDGRVLLVGGTSGNVKAYKAETREPLWEHRIKAAATLTAVAYSRDGKAVAATFRHGVVLLDATSGEEVGTINEPESDPSAVGFYAARPVEGIPEKQSGLAFSNARGTFVKTWIKWPNHGGIHVAALPAGNEPADRFAVPLAVDPRPNAVAHAVSTGPVHRDTGKNVLWAYGSGGNNVMLEGHEAAATAAAWSADGTTVVTGDADGVVIVWDAATFKEKSRIGFDRRVAAVAVTSDGSRAAVAVIANDQVEGAGKPSYCEVVHVWEPGKPKAEQIGKAGPFGGPFRGSAGLAFAPNGRELAAAYTNLSHLARLGDLTGVVRVWRLAAK